MELLINRIIIVLKVALLFSSTQIHCSSIQWFPSLLGTIGALLLAKRWLVVPEVNHREGIRKGEQQIHEEVFTQMIAVFAIALLLFSTMIARANVQTDCTKRLWFPLFLAALRSAILIKRWLECSISHEENHIEVIRKIKQEVGEKRILSQMTWELQILSQIIDILMVALHFSSTMCANAIAQTQCNSRLWFPFFLAVLGALLLIKRWWYLVCTFHVYHELVASGKILSIFTGMGIICFILLLSIACGSFVSMPCGLKWPA